MLGISANSLPTTGKRQRKTGGRYLSIEKFNTHCRQHFYYQFVDWQLRICSKVQLCISNYRAFITFEHVKQHGFLRGFINTWSTVIDWRNKINIPNRSLLSASFIQPKSNSSKDTKREHSLLFDAYLINFDRWLARTRYSSSRKEAFNHEPRKIFPPFFT